MDGLGDFTFGAWLRIDTLRDENHEVISGANAAEDNALSFWYWEETEEWVVDVFGQDQDEVGGGYEADEAWARAMDNLRICDRALGVEEVALLAAEPR